MKKGEKQFVSSTPAGGKDDPAAADIIVDKITPPQQENSNVILVDSLRAQESANAKNYIHAGSASLN